MKPSFFAFETLPTPTPPASLTSPPPHTKGTFGSEVNNRLCVQVISQTGSESGPKKLLIQWSNVTITAVSDLCYPHKFVLSNKKVYHFHS